MKTLLRTLPALLIALALVILAGCTEDENPPVIPPSVGSIEILVGTDTLRPIPDDSVSTTVTIVFRNETGVLMPGQQVNVSVADTGEASFWFTDSIRRDTTNDSGRVELWYRHTWHQGRDTITASVLGFAESMPMVICNWSWEVPTLYVSPWHQDIYFTDQYSAEFFIRLRDTYGIPTAGVIPTLTTSGGILNPLLPTDSLGRTWAYWRPTALGEFWVVVAFTWPDMCDSWTLTDTAWVTVLPLPVGQVRILAPDTLMLIPGDTARAPVTIIVSGQDGLVLPGRIVNVALMNPAIAFLEYVNPQLGDTTDDLGRLQMLYNVFDVGLNWIIATCEGVSGTDSILSRWAP
jgi:hypothetical protein